MGLMNHPVELILENFRCFRTKQRGRIRPITLLLGENSTGKSSFLASYMAIAKCFEKNDTGDFNPNFNLDPFELGSFGDILHTSADKKPRANKFKLGVSFSDGNTRIAQADELYITFGQKDALPQIHNLRHEFGKNEFIDLKRMASGTKISIPEFFEKLRLPILGMCLIVQMIEMEVKQKLTKEGKSELGYIRRLFEADDSEVWQKAIENISSFLTPIINRQLERKSYSQALDSFRFRSLRQIGDEITSMAPLRLKPERAYLPRRAHPGAEGEHIPLLLRELSKSNQPDWDTVYNGLIKFGESAELFSDIKIEDYGGGSNPFQVKFKVGSGEFINIMDVGYGVSQCLPVIVNILTNGESNSEKSSTFLLQQPEVHLHPCAQAEIGSLVCKAYAQFGSRFIIETHSDYIVDRIRLMVRRGDVNESDVSIIYFERESDGNSVRLFNIEVDSNGNIHNAPNSYRRFFIDEMDKVLGFVD